MGLMAVNHKSNPTTKRGNAHFPLIVGVAGGTGSGKTAIVNGILFAFEPSEVGVIAHDSYYRDHGHLSAQRRSRLNYDHPKALETELLADHLRRLKRGEAVEVPIYDFATHTRRLESRRINPGKVIMVEGLLVLAEYSLRRQMDVKIYIDAGADLRIIRRIERDVAERDRTRDSVVRQYREFVHPMHLKYVEPSKRHADIIITNEGDCRQAIARLIEILKDLIDKSGSSKTSIPDLGNL